MLKKLAGVCTALLALGSAVFACAAIGDLVGGTSATPTGVLVGLLVFFSGTTALGGWGANKLLRSERKAQEPLAQAHAVDGGEKVDIALEVKVLQLAKANGGRVTPAEVALACGVSLDQATAELDGLVARSYAELLVSDGGDVVYDIKGIMSAKEKAAAEEVLTAQG